MKKIFVFRYNTTSGEKTTIIVAQSEVEAWALYNEVKQNETEILCWEIGTANDEVGSQILSREI